MDRALIFVTLGFASLFFFAREGSRLSRERLSEIIIAIYTFSLCFARLFLPIIRGDGEPCGTFTTSMAIWPFYALSIWLIWIVAREKQWRIRRPNIWLVLIFTG